MTERVDVYAYEERGVYVVEWEGDRYESRNPFGLDSKLDMAGLPRPRNLHLVDRETAKEKNDV